jgi:hypothetical protein
VIDLLLPTTDAGVAVQFGAVILAGFAGLVLTRKNPDLRILVIGLTTLFAALMALRAVH